ncbi:MAG: NAD(P)-dependent oxidoreductase [Ignavibacteriales bacterium]
MKVGFFGAGLMGKPMIEKLIENGFDVNVFNRTIEKTVSLSEKGAKIFQTSKELIAASEVVLFMLADYKAVQDVFQNLSDEVLVGKQFIQMGTLSPSENIELKNFFENKNSKYFEAPVLGSIPQIKEKKLITFIGAEAEQYQMYKKIFESFSNKIIYVGEVGKASALKLALNQLIVSELAIFSMSLKYIINKGIDVELFMDVLRNSALYAPTFDKKLDNFLSGNFAKPNFPLKHMLKDLKLIINEFDKSQLNTKVLVSEESLLEYGIQNGFADEDYSAIYKCIDKLKSDD